MGDAKRRKAEVEALKARNATWLSSLPSVERIVAEVAQATYEQGGAEEYLRQAPPTNNYESLSRIVSA